MVSPWRQSDRCEIFDCPNSQPKEPVTKRPSNVQDRILATVDRQLRRSGSEALTLETIARETGCAKGLVNYHFKTKGELLAAAAIRLLRERESRWRSTLATPSLEVAVRQSWQFITAEAADGFWRAWASLSSSNEKVTVQTVNDATESFSRTSAVSVELLLRAIGLTPTITSNELGHLVGASVQGFGMQLSQGMAPAQVEGAHAALWAAILALTKPRRS
jgi:AcrR family transcriptional regulator